jgi:hypothetical protein
MFGMIDVSVLIAGTALGLVLGISIVVFLVYAAVNAARVDPDTGTYENANNLSHWSPITRHETQRVHLHVVVRDVEAAEW